MKKLVIIGSLMAALAVVIGAFGAHALKPVMTILQQQTYETGVKYHIIHSIGIIIIAILYHLLSIKTLKYAAYFMFAGIILFSFSLYLLALKQVLGISNWTFLGPITPIGGMLFIIAWLLTAWSVTKSKND